MKLFLPLISVLLLFAVESAGQSTGLYTYKEGYFIKTGDNWQEYRPGDKNGMWASYTQYGEDANYFQIKNSSNSLSVPKKSHNSFYIQKNGKWEILYATREIYDYFTDKGRQIYCYKGGYFVRSGQNWSEYRPQEKSGIWAAYTQYGEETNYFQISNSHCRLSIPKKPVNNIYISENSEWKLCYTTTDIYDNDTPSAPKTTPPAVKRQTGQSTGQHKYTFPEVKQQTGQTAAKQHSSGQPAAQQQGKYIDCGACSGTGSNQCFICMGAGYRLQTQVNYYTYQSYYIQVPCSSCGASGKTMCIYCSGTGKIYIPPVNVSPAPVVNPGLLPDDRSCSKCGGTATCQNCYGSGTKYNHVTGNTLQCTYCKGSGRCWLCNGTGYKR